MGNNKRKKYHKNRALSGFKLLYRQLNELRKSFPCYKCSIRRFVSELVCNATIQPNELCSVYKIQIRQWPGRAPRVSILEPKIEPKYEIHMYSNGTLCLYYPKEFKWQKGTSIAKYTIPWINEWIVYYEIYKISGKWEGQEAPHGNKPKLKPNS